LRSGSDYSRHSSEAQETLNLRRRAETIPAVGDGIRQQSDPKQMASSTDKCFRCLMRLMLSQLAVIRQFSNGRNRNTPKSQLGGTRGNNALDGYGAQNCHKS
jgi:hypothetical protein